MRQNRLHLSSWIVALYHSVRTRIAEASLTTFARSLAVRSLFVPLVLLGCGGSDKATGPKTADVVLGVSGLPTGSAADIVVTGPNGFSATVIATDTLPALAPGEYTIEARRVSHGGDDYAAAQDRQTLTVRGAREPVNAAVNYAIASGRLTVALVGLPVSPGTSIVVTGPGGFNRPVTSATQQFVRLVPGTYTIVANAVTSGLQVYVPDQPAHAVTVTASKTPATVNVAFAASTGLNFVIDGMYITQSVQRPDGSIPLVAGRDGFLRIFGRANVENGSAVPVRVRFYMNGALENEIVLPASSGAVPHTVDEGSLAGSWNVPVAASLIRPGLAILAEIDPGNIVPEVSETDNRFPASGTPLLMNVVSAPVFSIRFVSIRTDSTGLTGNVTEANKHQFMTIAQKIHPLPGYDADVRATPYITTAPPLVSGNGNGAWGAILSEINALRITEGSSRYYYGVVGTTYNSGVAGIGYVPGRASLGWDKLPSAAGVLAHEIGHNWGRFHAPCGGVGNPDGGYPHLGGLIGYYGFDLSTGVVKSPSTQSDIMGYCGNQWISDYTYEGILNHRAGQTGSASTGHGEAVVAGEEQPSLLVWGRIVDGKVVVEPSFEIVTRPAMPAKGGPYTIEGVDASGARVFAISFSGDEVADSESGERQFAFAVPMTPDRSARLTSIRAVGQGGGASQGAAQPSTAPDVDATVQAFAGDRVRVRWNSEKHPMMLVRDAQSGEVLSFARGGEVTVRTRDRELELVASAGARSKRSVAKVQAR